ncbi:MAG: hypothetical protein CBC13_01445 [Planctomycetia bacterium TMED53]|nr:MAG: hypothetical protein CBC13_01445 [Planctomycetia bacterium TMED53]
MKNKYREVLFVAFLFCTALLFSNMSTAVGEIIDDSTPVPPVGDWGGPDRVLTAVELEQWIRGRKVFDKDWRQSDGLGTPDMNADSCRACHQDPVIGAGGALDTNVTQFGSDNGGAGPFVLLPGGLVASKLRRPDTPGREDADPSADLFEQRQTPSLLGAGLIDGIADSVILANEDPLDNDGDGVRGVARFIDTGSALEVGKFGWKSQIPTVSDFVRDALGGEIGLTVFDDGRGFGILTDSDNVPDPEVSLQDYDDLIFYNQHLAAPPRAGGEVAAGEALFASVGCATCHIPELPGTNGPVPLYSNLLLHDIHDSDFRGTAEPDAGVGLYRTPPLWGLRKSAPYLHDGRATTIEDAIEQHFDEAENARLNYEALTDSEREQLLLFLQDL